MAMTQARRKARQSASRAGFTIVELLVVIAIIGVLASLLIAGVQKAREMANRGRCTNNLRQIGAAVVGYNEVWKQLPSGGWGNDWVGDPSQDDFSKKTNKSQTGGWIYNLLPHLEEQSLHDSTDIVGRVGTPVALLNCPSRRKGGPFPSVPAGGITYKDTGSTLITLHARSDYAANCGDQNSNDLTAFGLAAGGPTTLADGMGTSGTLYPWPDTSALTGVCFVRSELRMGDVMSKGAGKVYFAGEKYLNPGSYDTGADAGDSKSMYAGYGTDNYRCSTNGPKQDKGTTIDSKSFGGPHVNTCNMLYCDGSVRPVPFAKAGPDPAHIAAGNRNPDLTK